jgi:hypothetical protein
MHRSYITFATIRQVSYFVLEAAVAVNDAILSKEMNEKRISKNYELFIKLYRIA